MIAGQQLFVAYVCTFPPFLGSGYLAAGKAHKKISVNKCQLLKSFILFKINSFDYIFTEVVFSKKFRKHNLRQLPWQLEYSEVSHCLHFKLSVLGVLQDHILQVTQLVIPGSLITTVYTRIVG